MGHDFLELLDKWIINKEGKLKDGTLINYKSMIEKYIYKFFKGITVEEIDVDILKKFKAEYEDKIALKTLRNLFTIIKGTLDYAVELKFINVNYMGCIKLKKGSNKEIIVLSDKEQEKLYQIAKKNNYIGIILGLKCGLRIGEVLALKWSDIDFENQMLIVNKSVERCSYDKEKKCSHKIGNTKSNASKRKVPLNSEVINILLSVKKDCENKLNINSDIQDQFILSNRKGDFMLPDIYRKKFKKILAENEIRDIKFHTLRHTFATNMAQKKAMPPKTLSVIMGHTSTVTTQDYYVHPNVDDVRSYL